MIGEQSVRAMIPKLTFGDSGDSLAVCAPSQPAGSPVASSPSAVALLEAERKVRRERDQLVSMVSQKVSPGLKLPECQIRFYRMRIRDVDSSLQ